MESPQAAVDLVRADESFLGQIVSEGLTKLSAENRLQWNRCRLQVRKRQ